MKGKPGPDIVIAVADKAMRKGKSKNGDVAESDEQGMFDAMAKDMVKAVRDGDEKLLAKILEAVSHGVG